MQPISFQIASVVTTCVWESQLCRRAFRVFGLSLVINTPKAMSTGEQRDDVYEPVKASRSAAEAGHSEEL